MVLAPSPLASFSKNPDTPLTFRTASHRTRESLPYIVYTPETDRYGRWYVAAVH